MLGMPIQMLALKLNLRAAHHIPVWFHRAVCRSMGVRIHQSGQRPLPREAMLIVANHVSWLDISVIGASRPLVFVAKAELRAWPGFG